MRVEVSSGIIVFRDHDGNRKYLLLGRKEGFLDFPKGHIEKDETEVEAAIRETQEETGLKVQPLEGFRREMKYWFKFSGELIHKKVVMFVGEASDNESPATSSEHTGFEWLDYEEALGSLKFQNQKELLEDVEKFLNSLGL